MSPPAPPYRPVRYHASSGFVVGGVLTVLLWFLFNGKWSFYSWLFCWLVAINVVALAYYGYDKLRARQAGNRVPEVVLHALALAGGSLGAYAGMQLFRHKTIKGSFRAVFWTIVVLQVALIAWIIKRNFFE